MEEKKDIQPIDVMRIVKKLWAHKKKFFYTAPISLVITYLLMVCIPRYYSCTVSLAPEPTGSSVSGSLSSLASSFGIGSLAKMASQDAIFAEIYPDVIGSKDFIASLMPVDVTTKDGKIKCNYYTYMRDHQKAAWWDKFKGAIFEWIKPNPKDQTTGQKELDVFNLTKQQNEIFDAVNNNIKCTFNKKTNVVSITMKDQDPLVCATMANATFKKLQEFIVSYRTNKARIDLKYYTKLAADAKQDYERSRQRYGSYSDANMDVVLTSYRAKQEDLENEMQLKFNTYSAMNTLLQEAKAKVQERTPAFTAIQSASVPIKPAGPKRVLISLVVTFFICLIMAGWLLVKNK